MSPVTDPQTYFLQQGILGVIIVVLAGVIIWLQRKVDKRDEELKLLYGSVSVLQEKRISDAQQIIASSTKLSENMISSINSVQKSVDGISRVLELEKNR